jgi:hypothetical protein
VRTLRLLILGTLIISGVASAQGPVHPNDDYLVVASERLRATDGWFQVAGALKAKHDCAWVFFEDSIAEVLPELVRRSPTYIGFVAMPDEAGVDVVRLMNRLVRKLDGDPFADARWGLITAARWEDAMEVVRAETPLVVERLLANTGVPLDGVTSGVWFDEGDAGRRVEKFDGGAIVEQRGEAVIADAFAEVFNTLAPQLLITSGRTNEDRWMLGYTFDGGRVVDPDGDLLVRRPDGGDIALRSSGPMAMLGAGSCLLGHVPDSEALPLAFIRHGGVRQIVGYATTTWFGRAGWETLKKVVDEPGRYSLVEAAWETQKEIVAAIELIAPGLDIDTSPFDERDLVGFRQAVAKASGLQAGSDGLRELTGLLWDRDAFVVIGDPAWDVRLAGGAPSKPILNEEQPPSAMVALALKLSPRLGEVLHRAGANADELARAVVSVSDEQREAMVYMIEHMPAIDARSLPAAYLVEHVELAFAARAKAPWGDAIPDAIFFDSVVPYAQITERRDDWRRAFTEQFAELAWEAGTQEEAVLRLNTEMFKMLNVEFDANKRLKNDQSPYQTIDQACASCTGMSILLADACRAAGIPARLAGIPKWLDNDGNHTWVEVWDQGRWYWVEAFSPTGYSDAWWTEKVRGVARQDLVDPVHRIWAASWRATSPENVFPLPWVEPGDEPIPGADRTAAYAE